MLTVEQEKTYLIIKNGHNVVLLGQAGAGKTVFILECAKRLKGRGKSVALTATIGLAATHLKGITIHRWAGIFDGRSSNDEAIVNLTPDVIAYIPTNDILFIDEISMHCQRLF